MFPTYNSYGIMSLTIYNHKTNATLPSNYAKSNYYHIVFMRNLNLAILAATALSQSAPE
jgi:hypothetical protein